MKYTMNNPKSFRSATGRERLSKVLRVSRELRQVSVSGPFAGRGGRSGRVQKESGTHAGTVDAPRLVDANQKGLVCAHTHWCGFQGTGALRSFNGGSAAFRTRLRWRMDGRRALGSYRADLQRHPCVYDQNGTSSKRPFPKRPFSAQTCSFQHTFWAAFDLA